jgi:hypothetical protein
MSEWRDIDEERRQCKTNKNHTIGTHMRYYDYDSVKPKYFYIYRRHENEYEYSRVNNQSLWKNCNVNVVFKENGDIFLNAVKIKDGRHWNQVKVYHERKEKQEQQKPYNPFDDE